MSSKQKKQKIIASDDDSEGSTEAVQQKKEHKSKSKKQKKIQQQESDSEEQLDLKKKKAIYKNIGKKKKVEESEGEDDSEEAEQQKPKKAKKQYEPSDDDDSYGEDENEKVQLLREAVGIKIFIFGASKPKKSGKVRQDTLVFGKFHKKKTLPYHMIKIYDETEILVGINRKVQEVFSNKLRENEEGCDPLLAMSRMVVQDEMLFQVNYVIVTVDPKCAENLNQEIAREFKWPLIAQYMDKDANDVSNIEFLHALHQNAQSVKGAAKMVDGIYVPKFSFGHGRDYVPEAGLENMMPLNALFKYDGEMNMLPMYKSDNLEINVDQLEESDEGEEVENGDEENVEGAK